MDAKEARRELNEIRMLINKWQGDTFPSCVARDFMSVDVSVVDRAISALKKVETLEAENARLKINAEKWADLLKRAGAVGLNETDFFKMVETDKE